MLVRHSAVSCQNTCSLFFWFCVQPYQ